MKKSLITLAMLLTFALGQDYVMFENIYLDPRDGKMTLLQEGVKKHNQKYHDGSNGPKAYLWTVWTGPYSGQYVWGLGPMKLSHMDTPLSKAHLKDWDMNVEKYAKSHNYQYSVRDEE